MSKEAASSIKNVLIVIAHPDDEALWAGGFILCHPAWRWRTVCLCRGDDNDRSAKFYEAQKVFNSQGKMGCLDDGPDQFPMDDKTVRKVILDLLPEKHFDLIITHNPNGEYTRHIRHEETGRAVMGLWREGEIAASNLRTFAYEDGNKKYLPKAIENATIYETLAESVWEKKYSIITNIYGFKKDSWEALTTPRAEAFWQFNQTEDEALPYTY